MRRIIRSKFERSEDLRQHAPVIGAVGRTNRSVDATVLRVTVSPESMLGEQRARASLPTDVVREIGSRGHLPAFQI